MKRKTEKHFLEKNPEYIVIYYRLLKEATIWNNMAQYWLGKETMNKANYLLEGNIEDYNKTILKSEDLLYKTKKLI